MRVRFPLTNKGFRVILRIQNDKRKDYSYEEIYDERDERHDIDRKRCKGFVGVKPFPYQEYQGSAMD